MVDVQCDVEDIEREPREGEGHHNGDQEGVGPGLPLDLLLEQAVLDTLKITIGV